MNHAVFTDYLRFLFYESGNDTPILDIRIGTCQNDEIIPDIEKGKLLYKDLVKEYAHIHKIGYRNMPKEMYLNWLVSLKTEKDKYENKKLDNFSKN